MVITNPCLGTKAKKWSGSAAAADHGYCQCPTQLAHAAAPGLVCASVQHFFCSARPGHTPSPIELCATHRLNVCTHPPPRAAYRAIAPHSRPLANATRESGVRREARSSYATQAGGPPDPHASLAWQENVLGSPTVRSRRCSLPRSWSRAAHRESPPSRGGCTSAAWPGNGVSCCIRGRRHCQHPTTSPSHPSYAPDDAHLGSTAVEQLLEKATCLLGGRDQLVVDRQQHVACAYIGCRRRAARRH